jgi:hypothetical protein
MRRILSVHLRQGQRLDILSVPKLIRTYCPAVRSRGLLTADHPVTETRAMKATNPLERRARRLDWPNALKFEKE